MALEQVEMRYSQDDLHHKRHRSKLAIRRRSTPNLWPLAQRSLNEEKEAGLLPVGGTLPADTFSIYAGILQYEKETKPDSADSLSRKNKKSRRKSGKFFEIFKKTKEQKSFDEGTGFTGALFGQDLKDVCSPDGEPPLSVLLLLHQLVSHGPSLKGIFRVSANYKECQALKDQLDSGATVDFAAQNVKVLASTLKEYLRSLQDCLLTAGLYNDWVRVLDLDDVVERIHMTKKVLARLPVCNQVLLKLIMCVLHHIQLNSDYNKMTSYNLAICIGQSMLWPPTSQRAQHTQAEAQATMKVAGLLQFMLDKSLEIFGSDLPFILGETVAPKNVADSGTDSDSLGVSIEDSQADNFPLSGSDELQLCVSLAPEVRSIGSSVESPAPSPQSPRHITALPSHASSSLDSLELDSPETPDSCDTWHLSSDSGLFQSDLEQDHPPIPPPRRNKSRLRRQPVVVSPPMQRKSVSTPSLASTSPLPSPTQSTFHVQSRKCMTKRGADVYPKNIQLRRSLLMEEDFFAGDISPAMPSQPMQPAQPPSYDETMRRRVMLQSGLSVSNDEILQQKMNSLRAQELYHRSMEQYQAQTDVTPQTPRNAPPHAEMDAQITPTAVDMNTDEVVHTSLDTGRVPRRSQSWNVHRKSNHTVHYTMNTSKDNETLSVSSQIQGDVPMHTVRKEGPQNESDSAATTVVEQALISRNRDTTETTNVRSTARDTARSYNKTKHSSHSREKNNESNDRSESRVRKRAQAEKDRSSQKNSDNGEERVKTRRKSYRQQRLSDTRLETEKQNKVNLTRSKSDSSEHIVSLRLLTNNNNNIPQSATFNRPRRSSVTVKDREWHKDLAQQYSKPIQPEVQSPQPRYAYVNREAIATSTPDPKTGTGRRWSRPVHPTRDLVQINDQKKKGGQVQTSKPRPIHSQEEKENHHIPPSPVTPIPQPEIYSPQSSMQDQLSDEELTISWSVAKLKNLFDQSVSPSH